MPLFGRVSCCFGPENIRQSGLHFTQRDKRNGAGRNQRNEPPQRPENISWSNSSQGIQEAQHNPAPVGQSPFLGAVQGHPWQGGFSPQGNTQHGGFVLPANVAVAGGFVQPSSPTSPTRATQQDGFTHPGAFAPLTEEPQVLPPDVERDEYARISADGLS
jgi:hypothetical protein